MIASSKKLTVKEIKEFRAEISVFEAREEQFAKHLGSVGKEVIKESLERFRFKILPTFLFGAKHVFKEPPWTEEEIDLAVELSVLLAEGFDQPEFRVTQRDESSIRSSLLKIKTWFEEVCKDDFKIANMIATLDDGPFFGDALPEADFGTLSELMRTDLKNTGGTIVISKDTASENNLIMQYYNPPKGLVWSRRLTAGDSHNVREPIRFASTPVEIHKGFGFKLNMFATWTYGTERMHVYLDEKGDFRFYFLSW